MATHSERMLPVLINSAKKNDINLEIIGQGTKWLNYGNKLTQIIEYIKNINDNEIIFFLDGFDTLIIDNEEEIIKKYNILNKKIKDPKKKDLIFSNGRNFIRFFSNFLLEINSGLFIGKAKK
tara:strand:- start:103 stop:468 length:366 start_codon:yes stop_codon:yes gene_type:complete